MEGEQRIYTPESQLHPKGTKIHPFVPSPLGLKFDPSGKINKTPLLFTSGYPYRVTRKVKKKVTKIVPK
jgi:hypothetical protein